MNPNYEYLLLKYPYPFWYLIRNTYMAATPVLHKDGWLELDLPMDSVNVAKRTKAKIAAYRKNNLPDSKFSVIRFKYLIRTINYLKAHGAVYLIRLSVHQEMMQIENELMPDFNSRIKKIAKEIGVSYFDMSAFNSTTTFVDGNHIERNSGKTVTAQIGNWILKQKNN